MKKKPLISVLVATFNQAKVVEKTLNSIVAQTYEFLEILVSDDCSTDNTRLILNRIASSDSRIKLFLQEKNLGITKNYNFLAAKAAGEYVAIFAGDDVMHPEKISKQVELLEIHQDSSFCHHAVEVIDYSSSESQGVISHKYLNGVTTIHDVLRNLGIPGSMSIVYRRDTVKDPVFNTEISMASDWMQMIHLTMAGRGIYIDNPLCLYRKDLEYNGKDPSRYENDFLKTISLTRKNYASPGDAIDKSCDFALARYSLGAGYRKLIRGERKLARTYFKVAMSEIKFVFPVIVLSVFSLFPSPLSVLSQLKKIYKKIAKL